MFCKSLGKCKKKKKKKHDAGYLETAFLMQVSISSKTIPPWDKPPGHDLKGATTLPPGQSLCTKTLPSGQNRESKAPPPGHKVRKFHERIYKL